MISNRSTARTAAASRSRSRPPARPANAPRPLICPMCRRFVLFENRAIAAGIGLAAPLGAFVVSLPPAHVEIPRGQYIVDASAASEDDIYGALQALPWNLSIAPTRSTEVLAV